MSSSRSSRERGALALFKAGETTLAQSSKIADLSLEEFVGLLGHSGIPAVDYPPDELVEELLAAQP